MTTKFRAAMSKMATLGQIRELLTDCSGAHLIRRSVFCTRKLIDSPSDVIPVPPTITTKPFLPAGKTLKDVEVAVRLIHRMPVSSLTLLFSI
jgi:hypothetical protein